MRFSFAVSPRRGLENVLQLAAVLDYHNWGNIYCTDHLAWPGLQDMPECWTTLTAIAKETTNIGLGSLVSPPHFRHPALMAKIVAGVNLLSSGRLLIGLGTGWQNYENTLYGLQMPSSRKERLLKLEEYADCLYGLLFTHNFFFDGVYYKVEGSSPLVDGRIPIFVGGSSKEICLLSRKYSGVNLLGVLSHVSSLMVDVEDCHDTHDSPYNPCNPYSIYFRSSHSLIVPRIKGEPLFKIPFEMKDSLDMTKSGSVEELRDYIGLHQEIGISEFIMMDAIYKLPLTMQEDILCFMHSEIFDRI